MYISSVCVFVLTRNGATHQKDQYILHDFQITPDNITDVLIMEVETTEDVLSIIYVSVMHC